MKCLLFVPFPYRAATDKFLARESPGNQIDELEIVSSLLSRMPNLFMEALGSVDMRILVSYSNLTECQSAVDHESIDQYKHWT